MKQYIVGAPLERVSLETVGPLTRTPRRKSYILVIEAKTVAKVLVLSSYVDLPYLIRYILTRAPSLRESYSKKCVHFSK